MTRARALLLVSCSLGVALLVSPVAVPAQSPSKPATAAVTTKPVRVAKGGGRAKPASKQVPSTRTSRKPSPTGKKAPDCDIPAEEAKVAATTPIPVATDPLAPTVTPCPPGAPGTAGKH